MRSKKNKRRRKNKRWQFFKEHMSQLIVIFSIGTVLIFTVVDMVCEGMGISFSDTLIEWVYKFFGLEMLALSGIKISKHVGSAFGRTEEIIDGSEGGEEDEE